jgi:hypothetical protein
MKMRFVDILFFWIVSALPFLGEIHAVSTKEKEEQEQRELVQSTRPRIVGLVWIDVANPNKQGVSLNESGNNFNIRDFPEGATVQVITSEGMMLNGTILSLLWRQRPNCFIDTDFGDPLSFANIYGKWYMCGFSNESAPSACDLFSRGPIDGTATRCFTVTAHSDYGAQGVLLDAKNFTLNIHGALDPSSVYYEVIPNKLRPWFWFQVIKSLALFYFGLESEELYIRQGKDSKNVLSQCLLQRANLELGHTRNGWSPASVLFNYDNGSMVHLDNDRPFTLLRSTDFSFKPSVGNHTITVTLYSERNAKGASISHTVSFRVLRRHGTWCF